MKFIVYVETGKVGSRCEDEIDVPDEDLEGLTGLARDRVIEEYAIEVKNEICQWGWYPAEDGE